MFTFPFGFNSQYIVPAGLIIFFNDTSIPSGWSDFTSANDKYIVGADETDADYNAGDSGVAVGPSETSSTTGSHTGPTYSIQSAGGSAGLPDTTFAAGDHSHTVDFSAYEPEYESLKLIKADDDEKYLPANAVVLSTIDFSSILTATNDNGKILKIKSTIGSGGDDALTTSTDGSHSHISGAVSYGGSNVNPFYVNNSAGNHSHTASLTITPSIKRKILAAWTKTSHFNLKPSMIALWESATPPVGWKVCDGNNGTVDLRKYFIELSDYSSVDTDGLGDNTISATGSIASTDASHTHTSGGNAYETDYMSVYHSSTSWSHSHTIADVTDESYNPAFYALHFICRK